MLNEYCIATETARNKNHMHKRPNEVREGKTVSAGNDSLARAGADVAE